MSKTIKTKTKPQTTKTKTTIKSSTAKSCATAPRAAVVCAAIAGAAVGACAVGALSIMNIAQPTATTRPTVAKARAACEQYNGKETMQSGEILQSSSLDYDPLFVYTCSYNGNPHTTGIEFGEIFIDDGAAMLAQAKSNYQKNFSNLAEDDIAPVLLENSDTFLKYYMSFPEEENVYYVAVYGDTSLSLFAPNITIAEQVIADLGFPARSQASE